MFCYLNWYFMIYIFYLLSYDYDGVWMFDFNQYRF